MNLERSIKLLDLLYSYTIHTFTPEIFESVSVETSLLIYEGKKLVSLYDISWEANLKSLIK